MYCVQYNACAYSSVTVRYGTLPVAAATRMMAVSRINLMIWKGWRGVDWTLIYRAGKGKRRNKRNRKNMKNEKNSQVNPV